MVAISWSQIDTNGNGYVDGTEAVTAKAKGIKNVWNNMTELDYMSNTSKATKLSNIISQVEKDNAPKEGELCTTIHQWVRIGVSEEDKQKRKEEIENSLLNLNRWKTQLKEQKQVLSAELDVLLSKIDTVIKGIKNIGKFCSSAGPLCYFDFLDMEVNEERQKRFDHESDINFKIHRICQDMQNVDDRMYKLLIEYKSL